MCGPCACLRPSSSTSSSGSSSYGQCILFTLFAVVPVVQQSQTNAKSTSAIFLDGSMAYAVLSVAAKTLLGATYIAFVVLFPFKTET